MRTSRRAAVALVIAAVLAVPAVLGGDDAEPAVFSDRPAFTMPMVDAEATLSSTWFCAGGTAVPGGPANMTVVVVNTSDEPRSGRLTWLPSEGDAVVAPIELAPRSRLDARATNRVQAPHVAAVVELDGGGVAVEHTVAGPLGFDAAPCAPAGSDEWYLANGATTRDAVQLLSIFNPFPGDAVLDISFATDQGLDAPEAVQGLVVPGESLRVVNLTEVVRRRTAIATTIVARTGRVVVDSIQTFDGSEGRRGVGLTLAAPAAGEEWWFSEGLVTEGIVERFHVYNPGDTDAVVELAFIVEPRTDPVEPVEVTVPPRSALAVSAADSGVPPDVGHATSVRSLNGRPIVVEREITATAPAARRGYTSTLGARTLAEGWVLAAGSATDETDEWVIVHNPGSAPGTVTVVAVAAGQLVPIEGLDGVTIEPAGRLAVRMGSRLRRPDLSVLVTADIPVVVERNLFTTEGTGVSAAIGLPLLG